jgi:ParB-like chromosome segregation protein Spo0J
VAGVPLTAAPATTAQLDALGERLAALRLREPAALERVQRSLERHGQLSPVATFEDAGRLELIDGFKRLHAARALGWSELQLQRLELSASEAKLAVITLHHSRGLTELEEGWVVRSLYRDDGLSQPEIARRMHRHKSWVWRRLMLVEGLDEAVQADVRLGLLAARTAVAVAQLPRGNQAEATQLVVRHGMTFRQSECLVTRLLALADDASRSREIRQRLEGPAQPGPTSARARDRSEADWLMADITTLLRVSPRLQARLLSQPLSALGNGAGLLAADALKSLLPVLSALTGTVTAALSGSRGSAAA